MIHAEDTHTLTINKITFGGEGIGKIGNLVVFVPNSVPSDVLKIKITGLKKNYARGEIVEIIKPSENRINPPCEYYPQCGGCSFQHIEYEKQLHFKKEIVEDSFFRFAKGLNVKVNDCIGSDNIFQFRNKIQWIQSSVSWGCPKSCLKGQTLHNLHLAKLSASYAISDPTGAGHLLGQSRRAGVMLGLYEKNTHNIVDIDYCLIADEEINELTKIIRDVGAQNIVPVGAQNIVPLRIKHIIIRKSLYEDKFTIVFVTPDESIKNLKKFAKEIINKFPKVSGILANINKKDTNVILGDKNITLAGNEFLKEKIGNLFFYYHGTSFFQVNISQLNKIMKTISDNVRLSGDSVILDLYSGAGVLSLHLADKCGKIILAEQAKYTEKAFDKTIKANNINNAEFINDNVDNFLRKFYENSLIKPQLIILDPPRKGCTDTGIEYLKLISPPKIVYLSCDPVTLARDCKKLSQAGYKIDMLQPFDMFPQTYHVETLAMLEK